MNFKKRISLLLFIAFAMLNAAYCQQKDTLSADNIAADTVATDTVKKRSVLAKWWESIAHGNVDRTFERPIDMTFAVSPYYSRESSFGIGGQVSALYRVDKSDKQLPPCDISLTGGAALSGTYSFGLKGNTFFNRNNRLSFSGEFRNQRCDFWGINFDDCDKNAASPTRNQRIIVKADYQKRIYKNWFVGAALRYSFITADPDSIGYLLGQRTDGSFVGFGGLIQYDSRDLPLNSKRGIYFLLREVVYPDWAGTNHEDVYCTTVQFNAYHKLWKDCVMAYDIFGEFNTSDGTVPWQLREQICADDCRMRGYYSGSYIDDNQMSVQMELRQHIWKRFGAVAWVGAGTLFHRHSEMHGTNILPNYGVGVRFEMKANTNLRMDYGVGRGTSGIVFSFGEAF